MCLKCYHFLRGVESSLFCGDTQINIRNNKKKYSYHNLPNRPSTYVCVCVFVSLMKGSVTFDPNNTQLAQEFDGCTENGTELAEKSLKMCLVTMKNCLLFTGNSRGPHIARV